MAKKQQKIQRFTFNDPAQKNSHGFFIPSEGINLDRFKKNPVMLDMHYNSTYAVIGRWEDVKLENGLLTGVPVFDTDDEAAAKIAGKVERQFIRGCSMGIRFNPDDLKYVAGNLVLEKCELYEVSIVAVPSNANSIHLYHQDGVTLMTDEEIAKLCLSAIPVNHEEVPPNYETPENSDMKIKLKSAVLLALGFAATETEVEATEVEKRVLELEAKKDAAELKLAAKEKAEKDAKLSAIEKKVDAAIKEGKFTAEKKDSLIKLGTADEALLDETLGSVSGKQSLGAQVQTSGATEVKTKDDFQKLSLNEQLAFKAENPDAYKKLFN